MKKVLLFSILNVAIGTIFSYAQGYMYLDNYNSQSHPLIAYGPDSGGTVGTGIEAGFTVGVYFGDGAFADEVAADPSGVAIPTSLDPSLVLGSGPNTTTSTFILPGMFVSGGAFQANSVAAGISTFMVVAYNGVSYASSTIRGHSTAFEARTFWGTGTPVFVGDYMSPFSVGRIPEPSIIAVAGLGLILILLRRHR